MSSLSKPSTISWIIVHLMYPLLPVLIEGGIRYLTLGKEFRLDTINAATLAMSMALIVVFVNQSIRTDESRVSDEDEESYRHGICTFLMGTAIVHFATFAVLVVLGALVTDKKMIDLQPVLESFQTLAFVAATVPFVVAIRAQRSFKLRASLV